MLKPIKKASGRGQVFWQLRDPILRRTLLPESRLPSENGLSRTMGMSRVSTREGIRHPAPGEFWKRGTAKKPLSGS